MANAYIYADRIGGVDSNGSADPSTLKNPALLIEGDDDGKIPADTISGLDEFFANTVPNGKGFLADSITSRLLVDIHEINGSTSSRGAQSFSIDNINRELYVTEGGAISRYNLDSDFQATPIDSSSPNGDAIGHQGLGIEYTNDYSDVKLWTTSSVGGRFAVRFDYTPDQTIDTGEVFELFESGVYANSTSCTATISSCNRYLIGHGTLFGTYDTEIKVFDLSKVLSLGPGDISQDYLFKFSTQGIVDADNPVQGIACDGEYVYLIAGGTGFGSNVNKRLYTFTLNGKVVSKNNDVQVGSYLAAQDATGTRYEPEGLSIFMQGPQNPILTLGVLSGDPGSRRFRIWAYDLGKTLLAQSIDFVGGSSQGTNDVGNISMSSVGAISVSSSKGSGAEVIVYSDKSTSAAGEVRLRATTTIRGQVAGTSAFTVTNDTFSLFITDVLRATTDGQVDLGRSQNQFKDLYLSGDVYIGGDSIAEYGEDSNASWVKYSNGVMIQWMKAKQETASETSGNLFFTPYTGFTFSEQFIDAPTVTTSVTYVSDGSLVWPCQAGNPTTTGFGTRGASTVSGSVMKLTGVAYGRWK